MGRSDDSAQFQPGEAVVNPCTELQSCPCTTHRHSSSPGPHGLSTLSWQN